MASSTSFTQLVAILFVLVCVVAVCSGSTTQCTESVEERGRALQALVLERKYSELKKRLKEDCTTRSVGDWQDEDGNTALHHALEIKEEDERIRFVELLLRYPLNANLRNKKHRSPLHTAVFNGDKESVTQLLVAGADVMVPSDFGSSLLMAKTLGKDDIYSLLRRRFFHVVKTNKAAAQEAEHEDADDQHQTNKLIASDQAIQN